MEILLVVFLHFWAEDSVIHSEKPPSGKSSAKSPASQLGIEQLLPGLGRKNFQNTNQNGGGKC